MLLDIDLRLKQSARDSSLRFEPLAPLKCYLGGDLMFSLKRLLVSAAALLPALCILAVRVDGQTVRGAQPHQKGMHWMRGTTVAPSASATMAGPANIPYNGGAVLPSTTTYAIWWGKRSDFPSDAVDGIDDFLGDLDGSNYLHIADQYLFGQTAHTRFGGNFFDVSTAPPTQDPPTVDLVAEIYKVLVSNGQRPDPTAVYMLYTSNFPIENYYCAFHDYDPAPDGTIIHLAYLPTPTINLLANDQTGCPIDFDPLIKPNQYSDSTRGLANSTAHEFMETITDPNVDAWVDPNFNEIGDLCNYVFQTWVPLRDDKWKIQMIWSNQANGCEQGAGREGRVLGASASSKSFATFDLSDATYGTFAYGVNSTGTITGFYVDANNELHAFLRDNSGNAANVDPPGTAPGTLGAQALGINAGGAITGYFVDTNFLFHGFIRNGRGTFVTMDVPSAGVVYGTVGSAINAEGVTTGNYSDANFSAHGFVQDEHGAVKTFDAPGADNSTPESGTYPLGINEEGAITGHYFDANFVIHGFVRDERGSITTFDAPGAGDVPATGTSAISINDDGEIVGYYIDVQNKSHGYVRDKHGLITAFDVPGAIYGTYAESINSNGSIAGYYADASGFPHGFVRDKTGNFTTVDSPGKSYGTVLLTINDKGVVAGYNTVPIP
jgi:hypothetical protein